MSELLKRYTGVFKSGNDVEAVHAEAVFDALISEDDEGVLEEFLRAWSTKGTSDDELFRFASIMRERCVPIRSRHSVFVDVVGTGGSKSKMFNISTASAFVIAGAGVPVAKHGNRAATSNSGSADVLSELGVEPAVGPAAAERCLNRIGICFMFAPMFHKLSPVLAKVRRGLHFPTVFNNLGPLCNPAKAPRKVIGVWDEALIEKTARALARLGTERSWVVRGADGLDELTITGRSSVCEVTAGEIRSFEITPEDFGAVTDPQPGLECPTPKASAALIRSILDGSCTSRAAIEVVKINAAAAIFVAGKANTLTEAFVLATESVEAGSALAKLDRLAAETKKI